MRVCTWRGGGPSGESTPCSERRPPLVWRLWIVDRVGRPVGAERCPRILDVVTFRSAPSRLHDRGGLASRRRGRRRVLWGVCVVVALALLGLVAAVRVWSSATLAADATALAQVKLQLFAGTLESAHAFGAHGRPIPLSVRGGRLTPRMRLTPGELVSLEVVVRRPRWLGWALGPKRRERLRL